MTSSSTLDATNHPNSALTDGDFSTYTSTGNTATSTDAEYFKIDLGADYIIDNVTIGGRNGSDGARRFMLVTWPDVQGVAGLGTKPVDYQAAALYNRLVYTDGTKVVSGSTLFGQSSSSPNNPNVPGNAGQSLGPVFPDDKINLHIGVHKARYILVMSLQHANFDLTELQVFGGPPAVRNFTNGGVEANTLTGDMSNLREGNVPGWSTTEMVAMSSSASSEVTIPTQGSFMEVWKTGSGSGTTPGTVPGYEGNYFMELNAFTNGMVVQGPICVLPGETFNFSFAHRGREGLDVMRLVIDDIDVAEFSDNNAQSGTHTGTVLTSSNTTLSETHPTNANGWTLWSGTWTNNTGNSKIVTFGYRAVSSKGGTGGIGAGNFLDDVKIESLSALASFNSPSTSGLESVSTSALPKIYINGEVTTAATIEVNITGGTATRGTDYTTTPSSGVITVSIPVGSYDGTDATAVSLAPYIQITKDAVTNESPETINMTLQNPSAVSLLVADAAACTASNGTTSYTIIDDVKISGSVLNDADGLTDSKVDGAGTNAGGLNAVLVSSNLVVATVAVSSGGVFEFPNAQTNTAYTVLITSNSAVVGQTPPVVALPDGWVNTGEHNGADEGSDGVIDGMSASFLAIADVTNVNFGIEQLPVPDDKSFTVAPSSFSSTPSGGPTVSGYVGIPANSGALTGYTSGGSLTGTDPEDCTATGTCNTGSSFVINTIKTNTKLYYNNAEITAGVVIANFDPAKLVIYGRTGSGTSANPLGFTYSLRDAAGNDSPEPATYQITTNSPLPVTLAAFSASVSEELSVQLKWTTSEEIKSAYFEVMHSLNAKQWHDIEKVAANGDSKSEKSYSFTHLAPSSGINYYRLKMVDLDGTYSFSSIRKVELGVKLSIYPNPAATELNVTGSEGFDINFYDTGGKVRLRSKVSGGIVDLRGLSSGIYIIEIVDPNGFKRSSKIVVAK